MKPWIGVDLDGTLAVYNYDPNDPNHIGDPIPSMVERIKKWLQEGTTVKIFTARAAKKLIKGTRKEQKVLIHCWLKKHGLPLLEITNEKDYGMIELWDDRAISVETNTGRI
jgi:hypothetical protein